jgi:hypothetical protein
LACCSAGLKTIKDDIDPLRAGTEVELRCYTYQSIKMHEKEEEKSRRAIDMEKEDCG